MMDKNCQIRNAWPPCCCVAAFVETALLQLGFSVSDRGSLARELGIKVGIEKLNPWNLNIVKEPRYEGLTVSEAIINIPKVLNGYSSELSFRHIPFNKIAFGLFNEVLHEAYKKKFVIGVGFNSEIINKRPGIIRHVTRIEPLPDHLKATLLDDSLGSLPPSINVDWILLEEAVYSVDDGFWIIGCADIINLEHT